MTSSFAATLLILTIIASLVTASASTVYGQIITLQQQTPTMGKNTLSLNVSFANNTNATLSNEPITEDQGNLLVSAINLILSNQAEDLEDIEELEPIEEEEIIEDDSDNNGGDDNGDNDNDNGNNNDSGNNDSDNGGNDDNDNGNEGEPELPPIDPIELPVEGGAEIRLDLDEDEDQKEIITEGCADGLGYHKDGPYLCYPLDSIGEELPEGMAFCAALGCPYNPPDLP